MKQKEKIIFKKLESNNLILNATDFNEGDDRGDILLDGTDSDGTDAGSSLELEDELHEPKNKIVFERIDNPNGINHNAIINEDGGFIVPETSPISGSGPLRFGETTDVSVINTTTLQVATKASSGPSTASLGIVGLATPFGGADALETELGTISSKDPQEAHEKRRIGIIPTFFPVDIRQEGQLLSEDAGSGPELADISTFPLADFVRTGIIDIGEDPTNTNVTSETVGILLEQTEAGSFKQEDGTTVASTHGDDILLENQLKEILEIDDIVIFQDKNSSIKFGKVDRVDRNIKTIRVQIDDKKTTAWLSHDTRIKCDKDIKRGYKLMKKQDDIYYYGVPYNLLESCESLSDDDIVINGAKTFLLPTKI